MEHSFKWHLQHRENYLADNSYKSVWINAYGKPLQSASITNYVKSTIFEVLNKFTTPVDFRRIYISKELLDEALEKVKYFLIKYIYY